MNRGHGAGARCCAGCRWYSGIAAALLAAPSAFASTSLALINGIVYTADDHHPCAEAVVVVDGHIAYVGSISGALSHAPPEARRIDLRGFTVLPGLTDSHAHLADIGFRELEFDLTGTSSLADLKQRLLHRAASSSKPGDWLIGSGWIESRWTPPVFPARADLDSVVADRAVVLTRADGHALVANSVALGRAGIGRNTPDPPGGKILKDPATGEPTGMLIDNAMELIEHLIPPHTDAESTKALEVGADHSVQLGWTQLQIAGNTWREVDLLCRSIDQGRIKLRIYDAIGGPGADADRLLKEGASIDRCGGLLSVRGIKLYIDGALGSRGAALLRPYSDSPNSSGLLVNQPDVLLPILTQALRRGIQIETHAIGDRGNRIMLDLYAKAFAAVPTQDRPIAQPRWRIEHAQILDPADIPRFAIMGVIASMQPSHAISDMFFAPQRLGPERLAGAYAWHSLLETAATVVAGSDAPVEKGDPLIEFYAAVARRSVDGFSNADWHPEQRVSREQALKMLTSGPAYAAFQEKERGTIEIGKQADFSVFSADIMTIPEIGILRARPVMTIIGGAIVYSTLKQ